MKNGTPDSNRYRSRAEERKISVRGIHIVRVLCGIFLLLNLLLLYAILVSSQGLLGYHRHRHQVEEMEGKIEDLRRQNHKVFRKIQNLKSDAGARERMVREQLGWARENELVIEFLPSAKGTP